MFGFHEIAEGLKDRRLRDSPPQNGHVISREPFSLLGFGVFQRARFTIEIDDSEELVHAITGRYLLDTIPDHVRFYYSGDPSCEVFLFEDEEDPLWIGVACVLGLAFVVVLLLILAVLRSLQLLRGRQSEEGNGSF